MKKYMLSFALVGVSALYAQGLDTAPVDPVSHPPVMSPESLDEGASGKGKFVALKGGTLGVGFDLSQSIKEDVSLRLNINGLRYNRNETIDNIDYDGTLKFLTFGVLVDYYPSQSGFRLSGGAYYNGNKFEGSAAPSNTIGITIGDTTYYANEVGQLDTTVSFQSIAPYVGIGWGGNAQEKGWGFYLDLGVMYQGSPKIDAEATINPAVPQGTQDAIRADVEKERLQIEEDASSYKWYPVAMIGVTYTF